MKSRTKLVTALGLSLALMGGAAAFADKEQKDTKETKKATAKVGEAAPAFTLKDTKGTEHKLSDYAGKTVIIEWFNPDCPFCEGVYKKGIVKKTIDEAKAVDPNVVYIAVNSTANKPEDEVVATSDKFLSDQKMTSIPVLMDYSGTTGRAYGAKTTPHMFIIDGKGTLVYAGALTEKFDKEDSTNYVINAVKQMNAGETVTPSTTKSWGCSVKYASNNNDKNQGSDKGKSGKENSAGGKSGEKAPG
jgi:peroxiredoxin